ncbi:MAG: rod shape-determining protein [Candidatus Omnitrophica bacterium]|nr:rod shape-determining protein [Candidatus Omnitrophota bacterium]
MVNFQQIFKKVFNYILDLASNDIGIDLGTATTLVYVKGEGVVLCEPSVVAVERGTSHVLAVGEEAKRMLGRTPGNIIAIRPMRDGVITDFEVTEAMLRHFIRKVRHRRFQIRPRIVIAIPSGITEVERRAVKESAERAGARDVFLIEEPVAAAIGVGLPIQEPVGNMIIDIGGGTTEIAVISLAGIVFSKSIRIGGDEMNEAIIEYLKKTYNLMVGERTAEDIKIKIGSAYPLEEEMSLEVKGRDLIAGLPKMVTITSEEIRESLQEPLRAILEVTKISLERTPPELAADLIEHGIVIAGGGSLLKGLDKLISEETGLPVHIADDPVTAVANGTGKVLNEIKYLKKVTVAIKSEIHN